MTEFYLRGTDRDLCIERYDLKSFLEPNLARYRAYLKHVITNLKEDLEVEDFTEAYKEKLLYLALDGDKALRKFMKNQKTYPNPEESKIITLSVIYLILQSFNPKKDVPA